MGHIYLDVGNISLVFFWVNQPKAFVDRVAKQLHADACTNMLKNCFKPG